MRSLFTIFLSFFFSISIAQTISNQGLVLSFPFSGNALDQSGNGNHGAVYGAQLTTDRFGNPNNAYEFDGVDDYIEIQTVSDLDSIGDFTISVWFNMDQWEMQTGGYHNDHSYIFSAHSYSSTINSNFYTDGPLISLINDASGNFFARNNTFFSASQVYPYDLLVNDTTILGNWHHNVFVREGNQTHHYLNGNLIGSRNVSSTLLDISQHMFIGTFSGNNPNVSSFNFNFDGKIDDFQIYSRALDSSEVYQLFNTQGSTSSCISGNNLITYLPSSNLITGNTQYGTSIAILGDVNSDGNNDIAVGSYNYANKGAVFIHFLNNIGQIDSTKILSSGLNGIPNMNNDARFGFSIDTLGDQDGDGITEIAVGSLYDSANKKGALSIINLSSTGNAKSYNKISITSALLNNEITSGDEFGKTVANVGDIDKNGIPDLLVGAWFGTDSINSSGKAYIVYLDSLLNPISFFKIGNSTPGFNFILETGDYFGTEVTRLNDIDGNGVRDILISANADDDGGTDAGAVYICLLDSSHSLKSIHKISSQTLNLPFSINGGDRFGDGASMNSFYTSKRLFISAPFFDGFGNNKGVIHSFELDSAMNIINYQPFSNFQNTLKPFSKLNDRLGHTIKFTRNFFGNGNINIFLTSIHSDTLGLDKGVVFSMVLKDTCNACSPTVVSNQVSICPNDSVLSPKGSFVSTPGYYYDTLMTIQGCDSILSLQVSLNQVPQSTISPIVCEQYNYPSGKGIIDSSGSYLDTLTSHLGCDSLVQINLTVTGNFNMLRQSGALCSGSTYQLPNGNIVSTPGIYYDTVSTSIGCDSIIETTLTTGISYYDRSSANICQGNVFTSPSGKTFITSQNILDTLPTINGCDSVFEIFLTIHPTPTNVSIYPADTTICAGDFVTLNVGSYSGYQWSNASTQSSIMVSSAGTYTVTVSNSGNCTGTASTTVSITTNPEICGSVGIIELVEDNYKIFPNPTKDEVFISLNNLLGEANITLIDLKGTEYYKANTQVLRNKPIQINLTNISSGVYFIKIQDDLGVTTKKLIIQ